jgi:precorrin-4/cobalt-precorrin-4 C11-methyltransferase
MIYIVGAGPGDPELITVKGQKILHRAEIMIFAGSLVNPALLRLVPPNCEIHDSSVLTLDDVMTIMERGHAARQTVVRLHTGDPSLYGAIREQMDELGRRGIGYEVIPGVSSFSAAAAALKQEYTLPGVAQTVILTRMAGRTAVPDRESIAALAAHQATMVVFLSIGMITKLVAQLLTGYPPDTPAAVVYKASWPEERIIRSSLGEITALVQQAAIKKTALLLVGRFLGHDYELSKLYDKDFSHEFRRTSRGPGSQVGGKE